MKLTSDKGNTGVWYQVALNVEMDRDWGREPGYYMAVAMNVQHALANLGFNLAMAGALTRTYQHGEADGWENGYDRGLKAGQEVGFAEGYENGSRIW